MTPRRWATPRRRRRSRCRRCTATTWSTRSANTPWYDGPDLLEHLETVPVSRRPDRRAVPFPGAVRDPPAAPPSTPTTAATRARSPPGTVRVGRRGRRCCRPGARTTRRRRSTPPTARSTWPAPAAVGDAAAGGRPRHLPRRPDRRRPRRARRPADVDATVCWWPTSRWTGGAGAGQARHPHRAGDRRRRSSSGSTLRRPSPASTRRRSWRSTTSAAVKMRTAEPLPVDDYATIRATGSFLLIDPPTAQEPRRVAWSDPPGVIRRYGTGRTSRTRCAARAARGDEATAPRGVQLLGAEAPAPSEHSRAPLACSVCRPRQIAHPAGTSARNDRKHALDPSPRAAFNCLTSEGANPPESEHNTPLLSLQRTRTSTTARHRPRPNALVRRRVNTPSGRSSPPYRRVWKWSARAPAAPDPARVRTGLPLARRRRRHPRRHRDPRQRTRLRRRVRRAGPARADLRRIVITHGHEDHMGSAAALRGWRGRRVTVYAHRADAPIVRGLAPTRRTRAHRGRRADPRSRRRGMPPVPPCPVDVELGDGDTIDFGGGARVIATPGHTDGSIAVALPRARGAVHRRPRRELTTGAPARAVQHRPRAGPRLVRRALPDPAATVGFGHGDPLAGPDGAAAWRELGERCAAGPDAVPDPLG